MPLHECHYYRARSNPLARSSKVAQYWCHRDEEIPRDDSLQCPPVPGLSTAGGRMTPEAYGLNGTSCSSIHRRSYSFPGNGKRRKWKAETNGKLRQYAK